MQTQLFPAAPAAEPVPQAELLEFLSHAIRSSRGGRLNREAELYLAGVSAEALADQLALAGYVVTRRAGLAGQTA